MKMLCMLLICSMLSVKGAECAQVVGEPYAYRNEAELRNIQSDCIVSETEPKNVQGGTIAYKTVGTDYLEDALFIGDSRTSLLYEYSDWNMADYYVQYGMTIWDVLDTKIRTCEQYKGMTVGEALCRKQYGKIYIMLGINELGNEDAEGFYRQYVSVLGTIHNLQPQAVIYVQAILHVSDRIDEKKYYINNAEINNRNSVLSNIAEEEGLGELYYLDFNYLYDGEDGKLVDEYSFDGIHIKPRYMGRWQEYLLEHAVIHEEEDKQVILYKDKIKCKYEKKTMHCVNRSFHFGTYGTNRYLGLSEIAIWQ